MRIHHQIATGLTAAEKRPKDSPISFCRLQDRQVRKLQLLLDQRCRLVDGKGAGENVGMRGNTQERVDGAPGQPDWIRSRKDFLDPGASGSVRRGAGVVMRKSANWRRGRSPAPGPADLIEELLDVIEIDSGTEAEVAGADSETPGFLGGARRMKAAPNGPLQVARRVSPFRRASRASCSNRASSNVMVVRFGIHQ